MFTVLEAKNGARYVLPAEWRDADTDAETRAGAGDGDLSAAEMAAYFSRAGLRTSTEIRSDTVRYTLPDGADAPASAAARDAIRRRPAGASFNQMSLAAVFAFLRAQPPPTPRATVPVNSSGGGGSGGGTAKSKPTRSSGGDHDAKLRPRKKLSVGKDGKLRLEADDDAGAIERQDDSGGGDRGGYGADRRRASSVAPRTDRSRDRKTTIDDEANDPDEQRRESGDDDDDDDDEGDGDDAGDRDGGDGASSDRDDRKDDEVPDDDEDGDDVEHGARKTAVGDGGDAGAKKEAGAKRAAEPKRPAPTAAKPAAAAAAAAVGNGRPKTQPVPAKKADVVPRLAADSKNKSGYVIGMSRVSRAQVYPILKRYGVSLRPAAADKITHVIVPDLRTDSGRGTDAVAAYKDAADQQLPNRSAQVVTLRTFFRQAIPGVLDDPAALDALQAFLAELQRDLEKTTERKYREKQNEKNEKKKSKTGGGGGGGKSKDRKKTTGGRATTATAAAAKRKPGRGGNSGDDEEKEGLEDDDEGEREAKDDGEDDAEDDDADGRDANTDDRATTPPPFAAAGPKRHVETSRVIQLESAYFFLGDANDACHRRSRMATLYESWDEFHETLERQSRNATMHAIGDGRSATTPPTTTTAAERVMACVVKGAPLSAAGATPKGETRRATYRVERIVDSDSGRLLEIVIRPVARAEANRDRDATPADSGGGGQGVRGSSRGGTSNGGKGATSSSAAAAAAAASSTGTKTAPKRR